jgi:alanine dehydrogenase
LRVGVPREIKDHEYRVGLVPATVRELVTRGHSVMVERGAGAGAGIADAEYEAAGAELVAGADPIFERAEMIVKVKEPLAVERPKLKRGQILFTYLHLAADRAQTEGLMNAGVIGIAYETVTAPDGSLPLLTPMSQVAGRMAPQVGAYCLQKANGGRGVLLAGVPGVDRGSVLILGAGHVGANAALIAVGMGANVTVVGRSKESLARIAAQFGDRVRTQISERAAIENLAREADLVIGAAMVPGGVAPKLLSRATVQAMRRGAVIVDVSIDQGGVAETSRPTSHSQPTYIEEGVVHYCVPNMPGAVPRTSTFALNNATRPFVLALADKGWARALADDRHLLAGLNVHEGRLTYRAVADALKLPYTPAEAVLSA